MAYVETRATVQISKDHHHMIIDWIAQNQGLGTITRFVELAIQEKLDRSKEKFEYSEVPTLRANLKV